MTRSWLFTLTDTTKVYNLWTDLITRLPGFDPTFSNFPFVPTQVQELEVQNQTPGATVLRNGFILTGGSWDVDRGAANNINVKGKTFQTDTNPTVIYVKLTAN